MTTDQAYRRLVAKAEDLRAKGLHEAAHDYQRRAGELANLARMAANLPAPPRRRPQPVSHQHRWGDAGGGMQRCTVSHCGAQRVHDSNVL